MNPYTQRGMIRDSTEFFGRTKELRDIFTLLWRPQSCSIVGPRRIGKSSLLYHLCCPKVYGQYLTEPETYVFVFLDLLELAELSVESFFLTLLERITEQSQGRVVVDSATDTGYGGFSKFIRRQSEEGWKFILCFDEFERMCGNPHFDDDFFGYLRSLAYNYNLAYVTASRRNLYELCLDQDIKTSQFWNIFTTRNLGLMTKDEAIELATVPFTRAGGHIRERESEFILEFAGTHPLFVQIACYHLFAMKKEKGKLDGLDYDLWRDDFHSDSLLHFKYAWRRLSRQEQRALRSLAEENKPQLRAEVVKSLQAQALITDTSGTLSLSSGAFRTFVLEQPLLADEEISPRLLDDDTERAVLEQELDQHKRNLYKLRQQAAIYAAGETPLHLLNQIEAEEMEIRRIEEQLRALEDKD
jgi:hypothetical protein